MIPMTDIQKIASEIIAEETLRLDMNRIREDLMGLYGDIVAELTRGGAGKETMIYDYAELMAREQALYIPEQAYEAGVSARDTEHDAAFMDYIRSIHLDPETKAVLRERDNMYYELSSLLGDAGGLLDEWVELYRDCHGIIGQKIDRFFNMGYYGADNPKAT